MQSATAGKQEGWSSGRPRRGSKPPANIGRNSLPPSTSPGPPEPKTYYLVVCGATDGKDSFIFSHFMAWCMLLKDMGIEGDFMSCFPLGLAFEYLKNNNLRESIRFVKISQPPAQHETYVYEYTRADFQDKPLWYLEVDRASIKIEVIQWVLSTAQKTRAGDEVLIIFESHGHNITNELILGDHTMSGEDFASLISHFPSGVEVESITGACYSGRFPNAIEDSSESDRYAAAATTADSPAWGQTRSFSDRVQNSRYSQDFVQSFARLTLPEDEVG